MDATRISFHRGILQNVPLSRQEHESRLRNFRPISPVKLISSFLGGGSVKQRSEQPTLKSIPPIVPQFSMNLKPDWAQVPKEKNPNSKVSVVGANSTDNKDTLTLLQDTLATYLVALLSRSGNVVGRVLRGRGGADELVVNELYNVLGLSSQRYSFCYIGLLLPSSRSYEDRGSNSSSRRYFVCKFREIFEKSMEGAYGPNTPTFCH